MSAPDAIRRAQAWLAATERWGGSWEKRLDDAEWEAPDHLAALGPSSVGLAAQVDELLRGMSEEAQGVFFGVERARGLRDALAEWCDAAQERPEQH